MCYFCEDSLCIFKVLPWNQELGFDFPEQERSDWIGSHKIIGKANYVTETCRSHETIYDSNLTDYEREGMRTNIFNTLQRDGSAQAHDMLNKAQLLWNKSCTKNPNFDTVRMKNQSV